MQKSLIDDCPDTDEFKFIKENGLGKIGLNKQYKVKDTFDEIFEKQGICCFTKSDKPDNKHFWSLYAGNYSGFALEFDEDELNSVYALLHLEKVHYFNNPMNLDNCKNTFSTNQSNRIYTVKECIDEFTNPVECNPEPLDRLFQYLHLKSMG